MEEEYNPYAFLKTKEVITQEELAEVNSSEPALSQAQEIEAPLDSTEYIEVPLDSTEWAELQMDSDEFREGEPMEIDEEEQVLKDEEQHHNNAEEKKVESPEAKAARYLKDYEKSCQEAWSLFISRIEEECDLERLPSGEKDMTKPTRRQKHCLFCNKRVPLKHEHFEESRRIQGGNVLHLATRIVESEI